MNFVRILADDLTGALDSAAAFAAEVPVYLEQPPAMPQPAMVSAVATSTRDIAPTELPARLAPALSWLREGRIAFKKIDSLLRGNTFAELAWLAEQGCFARLVFAPAFPAQGRLTCEDMQWTQKCAHEKPVLTPVLADKLSARFAEYGLTTSSGTQPEGARVWIPTVRNEAELDEIARLAEGENTAQWLWCGSAGLAHALARTCKLAAGPASTKPASSGGDTLLISASYHPVTREQWVHLARQIRAEIHVRHAQQDMLDATLAKRLKHCRQAWFDLSPQETLPAPVASALRERQIGQIVQAMPRPQQLLAIGGDTLLSICRASRTGQLQTLPSARAGWGCARLVGGLWDGVICHSRSGAFGTPDDLLEMIQQLNGLTQKEPG